jgi:hypothetical protein
LVPPKNVTNLFRNWLKGSVKKDLIQIRVGVCTVIWALQNTKNDSVFGKPKKQSFLHVIPVVTHWIHTWSYKTGKVQEDGFIQPVRLAVA